MRKRSTVLGRSQPSSNRSSAPFMHATVMDAVRTPTPTAICRKAPNRPLEFKAGWPEGCHRACATLPTGVHAEGGPEAGFHRSEGHWQDDGMNLRDVTFWSPDAGRRGAAIASGVMLTFLICFLHLLTGPAYEFHMFFSLPVSLVTWYAGAGAGYGVAGLAGSADRRAGRSAASREFPRIRSRSARRRARPAPQPRRSASPTAPVRRFLGRAPPAQGQHVPSPSLQPVPLEVGFSLPGPVRSPASRR